MTAVGTHRLRKLSARIGAEVSGVDLGAELDSATIRWLVAAVHEHKVVGVRDQRLDDTDQQRLAARFGDLTTAHPTIPSVAGEPRVLAVDKADGYQRNEWHTDVSFVLTPPKVTTVRAVTVSDYGGNTLFANTAAAYRDMPSALRTFADSLDAIHTNAYEQATPNLRRLDVDERNAVFTARFYESVHPVVRVHPRSAERALFIGGFADRVVGLSRTESRDVIRLLQSYVVRPENTMSWRWEPGDVVLWDNRVTQQYEPDDFDDLPRRLHRVAVAGEVPTGVDGRRSYPLVGDATHYSGRAAVPGRA